MSIGLGLFIAYVVWAVVTGKSQDDYIAEKYAGLFGEDQRKANEAPTENPNVGKYLLIAALVAIAAVSIWEKLQ
jgi:hypothetical protein